MRRICLAVLTLALAAPAARAELPAGAGLLLPVQDRVGDPETAALVEAAVRQELSAQRPLREATGLRAVLRRLRIRDVAGAPPPALEQLAGEFDAGWFCSLTLHEASATPVPRVTVSAQIYAAGDDRLHWAGLEAASGLDDKRWLGLGGVADLAELAEEVSRRLVQPLTVAGRSPAYPRLGSSRTGFLLPGSALRGGTRVAVVPFDSIADWRPAAAGDLLTQAALAELHDQGMVLVLPALVSEVQRRQGRLWRGQVDAATRSDLHETAGAERILTGTVEIFDPGLAIEPEPWISLSARLLDGRSGGIEWSDGLERRGRDSQSLFRLGRTYSAGVLARAMVRSLLAGAVDKG